MRSYAWPLLAAFALTINACGGDGQQTTDAGTDSSGAAGRGGAGGRGGSAGTTGGSDAGAGRGGTGGSTGGSTAGTGGSAMAGTGGGATAGTGGGATAGTGGGATAGTGGGSTAGRGGSTAGTGGGATAGTGGGATAGTGGGATAGTGGGATAGTGGGTAGTGGAAGIGGAGGTVACTSASTCPGGADTQCQRKTCLNNFCGLDFTPANTAVAGQVSGDCHQNVCDGIGNVMNAIFDGDPPADDANPCTDETCVNGLPSHPPEPARTPCSQGVGTMCNGNPAMPACVLCLLASDCPGTDSLCRQRACSALNTCGFSNAQAGTAAEPDTTGNCQKAVCNGTGGVTSTADDNDVPADDGNVCTNDVCASGTPSHPAKPAGTPCSQGGAVCSGTSCVGCVTAADCPGTDTVCRQRNCNGSQVCGFTDAQSGTPADPDAPGNCQKAVCNGSGGVMSVADNGDVPVDGNVCTSDLCTNGAPSNPNRPPGTICAADNSKTCDATAACNTLTFRIVRIGPGTSNQATAVAIEERRSDGTLVGTPIAMPTAVSGANRQLTMSASANSEGCLSLSADGRYLALAGYGAPLTTAGIKGTTGNRVAGLVDAAGVVNTSTVFDTGDSGDNVRSATTLDGTDVWIAGAGNPATNGGVWSNMLGLITGEVHTLSAPDSVRCLSIFGGQLYASAPPGTFTGVFKIGFGTPTAPSTGDSQGMPTGLTNPFGFAMFDLPDAPSGLDTIYIADDAAGVQKWTYDGSTWSLAPTTLNISGNAGFRGVAGYAVGKTVTLMASTAESSPNRLVVFTDDNVNPPVGSAVVSATTGMVYRGVAVSPHFPPP